MKKLTGVVGVSAVLCSATAFAAPDPARVPLENAVEIVSSKSAARPDNRGLQNATRRITTNIQRQQEKRANHPPGQHKLGRSDAQQSNGRGNVDRAQVADRTERVERVERIERPERSERPERPDRPERP